jgi:hypothetical protein
MTDACMWNLLTHLFDLALIPLPLGPLFILTRSLSPTFCGVSISQQTQGRKHA